MNRILSSHDFHVKILSLGIINRFMDKNIVNIYKQVNFIN